MDATTCRERKAPTFLLYYRTVALLIWWFICFASYKVWPYNVTGASISKGSRPRWNMTQLKHSLLSHEFENITSLDRMHLVPKPGNEAVEIYNLDSWRRLRELLLLSPSTATKVQICSVGGSSTAGGGMNGDWRLLWDNVYVEMLQRTSSQPLRQVEVINRGHGARGSAHSTFVMHSIVPASVDIMIWEFALNDDIQCPLTSNALIMWLEQVKRMRQSPPLVILAYIWDPFIMEDSGRKIRDTAFRCHDRFAAAYNFVVGSVNLASYIRNIDLKFDEFVNLFLADIHHPTALGHWFLGYLLWDLTTDMKRQVVPKNLTMPPRLHWDCEVSSQETITKERIDFMLNEKYPWASWTGEPPSNEVGDNAGMLEPEILYSESPLSSNNLTFLQSGKASAFRLDRKLALQLPCCSTGQRIRFNTSQGDERMMTAMQVYALNFMNAELMKNSISVDLLDHRGAILAGGPSLAWVTLTGIECMPLLWFLSTWLVLPEPTPISQMIFCNSDISCGHDDSNGIALVHVSVF